MEAFVIFILEIVSIMGICAFGVLIICFTIVMIKEKFTKIKKIIVGIFLIAHLLIVIPQNTNDILKRRKQ